MRVATTREHELLERILRRIDRKVAFQAYQCDDGNIEVRLTQGRLATTTRLTPATLEASAENVMEFEAARTKIKRVIDRMHVPAPPPKMPRVEVIRDVAFGPRMGGGGGGRGRR